MVLAEKLALFNNQQEKWQASLATHPITASTSVSRNTPAPALPSRSQPLAPLPHLFSFTDGTEKLQQIATIQNSPVGAQIKRVLNLLLKTRRSLLPEEINDLCFVDVKNNKDVLESLKSNVKASFDGQRFAYKSKHDLKNKEELLVLVRTFLEGVPMCDLKDSYPGIQADVQNLKATGEVWVLMNSASQEDIIYPNDPNIVIKVDEDLKQLIRGIDTPREFMDVEREMQKAGIKMPTNSARREFSRSQTPKPLKKKRREFKRTKHTNAHLPELFNILPSLVDNTKSTLVLHKLGID